jgi:hypothetical protein
MNRTPPLILLLILILSMGLACNLLVAKASSTGHSQSLMRYDAINVFSGNITSNETQWGGFADAQGIAIGDLYNNGSEEAAISEGVLGTVVVVKANGKTTPSIVSTITGFDDPFGVAIGDLYNDGVNVIAVAEPDASRVTVCYLNGSVAGTFSQLNQPVGVAIGDFYNNHQNVIAIAENGSASVLVLESGGNIVDNLTGIFSQPEGVAIGDLTNDGQMS